MSTSGATSRPRPHVAILIVNGFARGSRRTQHNLSSALEYPWIDLCLRQIERHSQGWSYEVFVFDNSNLKLHRKLIRQYGHVRVLPDNWIAVLGRMANRIPVQRIGRVFERPHPSALDYLASKVPADFDYIVTLDTDSFPVRDDWLDVLVSECERGAAVTGVYRNEMAPTIHPFVHVSGLCVRQRDLRALNVSFGKNLQQDSGYNQDVGQKITYDFSRLGRTIAPLKRSNSVNYHFLMGGIYGDVIYHHGAGSRKANFWTSTDLDDDERVNTILRKAAFQDLDHLIALLRGQAVNDLDLSPLGYSGESTQAFIDH